MVLSMLLAMWSLEDSQGDHIAKSLELGIILNVQLITREVTLQQQCRESVKSFTLYMFANVLLKNDNYF
ncbi:hypothetical protein C0J52_26323 [Blattella germanica]|nr:hypothetical protein C0J52_26323 [Blattella germanica]